jgi:hypothetical protein
MVDEPVPGFVVVSTVVRPPDSRATRSCQADGPTSTRWPRRSRSDRPAIARSTQTPTRRWVTDWKADSAVILGAPPNIVTTRKGIAWRKVLAVPMIS